MVRRGRQENPYDLKKKVGPRVNRIEHKETSPPMKHKAETDLQDYHPPVTMYCDMCVLTLMLTIVHAHTHF